jgi:hypothetical protein
MRPLGAPASSTPEDTSAPSTTRFGCADSAKPAGSSCTSRESRYEERLLCETLMRGVGPILPCGGMSPLKAISESVATVPTNITILWKKMVI